METWMYSISGAIVLAAILALASILRGGRTKAKAEREALKRALERRTEER